MKSEATSMPLQVNPDSWNMISLRTQESATILWLERNSDNVITPHNLVFENNNIPAIKQLYRNNEFQTFVLTADLGIKIIDSVVTNNFENHFLLNLLECLRGVDKEKLLIPSKNFEKFIQNINDLP